MNHKPMKDELTTVAKGLKLSSKPDETWLHFGEGKGKGKVCSFCIEHKFPAGGAEAIKRWAYDRIEEHKTTALDYNVN